MSHTLPTVRAMCAVITTISASNTFGAGCPDPHFDMSLFGAGDSPRSVELADLDGDGDLDMAVANSWTTSGVFQHGTEGVHVLLNDGTGTYGEPQFHAAGYAPQDVAVGDLDGDGAPDLVVPDLGRYGSTWTNYGLRILFNDGDGGFAPAVFCALDPGYVEPRSVALGDLNHDGHLDVVVTVGYSAYLESEICVLLNNGDGTLSAAQYFSTGYGPYGLALSDLDGDGELDAVTANYSANSISILYGDGQGGFGPALHQAGFGQQPRHVVLTDFDGNGVADIAVANHDNIIVRLDNGNRYAYTVGLRPSCIATGDFDGDGAFDLAATNSLSDNVSILRNVGNGTFAAHVLVATGDAPYGAAFGDVDGSGFDDIVVMNMYTDSAAVLVNDCAGACVGDLDGDGSVGVTDLLGVLSAWGDCGGCAADLDGDGMVAVSDLLTLLSTWGDCP